MNKEENFKMKTCVLNIHCFCEGCKRKVKQLLKKVDGVHTVIIDEDEGRVKVTGTFEPENLRKKLEKSGKHAEIMEIQSGLNRIKNPTQFEKIQIGNGKVGKGNKQQNSDKTGVQVQAHQKMKGAKVLISPSTEKKTVKKVDLTEEDFDVICSDEDSDGHKLRNKIIPMKGKGPKQKGFESIDLESRKSCKNRDGENGGSRKNGGLFGLRKLLGIVKNGRKAGFEYSSKKSSSSGGESGGEKLHGKSAKKVAAKKEECFELDTLESDFHGLDMKESGAGNSTGDRWSSSGGKIWNKGQMGHGYCDEKKSQVSNIPVVQGLPDQINLNGGYYPVMMSRAVDPYPYGQQHMTMMINQQRADVFPPAAYSQSFPAIYHDIRQQPASPPRRPSESYAHYFSDENADGCNIM